MHLTFICNIISSLSHSHSKSELKLYSTINSKRNKYSSLIPCDKLLQVTKHTTLTATKSDDRHSKLQKPDSKSSHNVPETSKV